MHVYVCCVGCRMALLFAVTKIYASAYLLLLVAKVHTIACGKSRRPDTTTSSTNCDHVIVILLATIASFCSCCNCSIRQVAQQLTVGMLVEVECLYLLLCGTIGGDNRLDIHTRA